MTDLCMSDEPDHPPPASIALADLLYFILLPIAVAITSPTLVRCLFLETFYLEKCFCYEMLSSIYTYIDK